MEVIHEHKVFYDIQFYQYFYQEVKAQSPEEKKLCQA